MGPTVAPTLEAEPEPEPESEPEVESELEPDCTDSPLPAAWSHNGIYGCEWYFNHGGLAYCAHEALKEHCCFCRGPSSLLDASAPKRMAPAPKLHGRSFSRRQRFLHRDTSLMQLHKHDASLEL